MAKKNQEQPANLLRLKAPEGVETVGIEGGVLVVKGGVLELDTNVPEQRELVGRLTRGAGFSLME